jgi:hypothetical protein
MDMPTRQEMVDAPAPPDPLTGMPPVDPMTGQPQTQKVMEEVPIWMPNEWDSIPVWQQQLGLWMKTQDFEALGTEYPERAEVAKLMWAGLRQLKQQEAERAAQQQQAMAQSLGMGNAAAPQGPPSPPSVPNAAGMPASGQNDQGAPPPS